MIHWFTGPLKSVVTIFVANESTRQIAAGATIGVVLGLLPTGNLISFTLLFLLAALRVNRMAGLGMMALVSLSTPWIDPFLHTLGVKVLTLSSLQPTFAGLYDAPLGAWIGFHNTVTIGALLVGLYAAYPVYLLIKMLVDAVRPAATRWILKYRIGRVLLGVDLSSRFGITA